MRSVWKGFIIGGISGAAVGLMLDLLGGVREGAAAAAGQARDRGPEITSTLASKAADGADWARQAGLPGKLHDAAQSVATSDAAHALRQRAAAATVAATEAAKNTASTLADKTSKDR